MSISVCKFTANYACYFYFLTKLSLSRKNVVVEVVQATDAVFQKTWIYKASFEDKQYLESLPTIKFASLSSFVAGKRVNLPTSSWNKKHSRPWCKQKYNNLFLLNKFEQVRLYTWYLLIFTKRGFTSTSALFRIHQPSLDLNCWSSWIGSRPTLSLEF